MLKLKALYVVTGTVRVEGGETNQMTRVPEKEASTSAHTQVIMQERDISKDRRRANVISTDYMRRLRGLRVVKTPFGNLVDPLRYGDVQVLVAQATKDVREFNLSSKGCKLFNCMVVEWLGGNRLAAVSGWLARQAESNKKMKAAVAVLAEGAS
jgi:hypothetical protein